MIKALKWIKYNLFSGVFYGYQGVRMKNPILKAILLFISRILFLMKGNKIVFNENIGEGLELGYGWGITINSRAIIGRDCVLFKGCTIGSIRSGKRAGWPQLGNRVVVGFNAFIGGG